MERGKEAYWRVKVGAWIYEEVLTTQEALNVMQRLSACVLNLSLERLTTVEELTA